MRLIPLAILCAFTGITYWVGATFFTARIEQDINTRSNEALANYQPSIQAMTDGRDVTLTGKVIDEHSREEALNTVDSLWGVRATRDSLAIMGPYNVHGSYQEGGNLIVDGSVYDALDNQIIKDTIAPITAISSLETDARPMTDSGAKLALATGAIVALKKGEMWIDEDQLKITGEAYDQQSKDAIEQELKDQQAMIAPLRLVTNITALTPEPAPISLSQNCLALSSNAGETHQTILFDVDSDVVSSHYHDAIQSLVALVNECSLEVNGSVVVEAHADQDGSENYNFDLSQRRATQVSNLLRSYGLDDSQFASFSFGETRPVASNENNTDKSYNRRVEVRFINDSTNVPEQQFSSSYIAE